MCDYKHWLEHVSGCKYMPQSEFRKLCSRVEELFAEESNVVPIRAPVVVCGDIHGQFFDLLTLFETGGPIETTQYVFMGDYVDRGYYSLETITYLLLLKAMYPNNITLLRGNHESRGITRMYGFYDECILKYGTALPWAWCMNLFDLMSVSACIEGRIFCVHGGLSPDLKSINQVRALIQRKQEIPHSGPFCDLMWSDPEEDIDGMELSSRGAGYLFGATPVKQFVHLNKLDLICRAHQLVNEGYQYLFDNMLVTVWSAPNYCYRCGNIASVLSLDSDLRKTFKTFDAIPEDEQIKAAPQPHESPYFL